MGQLEFVYTGLEEKQKVLCRQVGHLLTSQKSQSTQPLLRGYKDQTESQSWREEEWKHSFTCE